MINAIQAAYYQKAKNPSHQSTLLECALETGLDGNRFANDLTSDEIEQELQNDLKTARSLGVFSFPSLRLEHDGRFFPVSVDYLDHETMIYDGAKSGSTPPIIGSLNNQWIQCKYNCRY